ncbi:MAG: hypothetical protein N3A64_04035 [Desulfobacterota bacterium]|nr:hypothetical protein [Thermodesulfobacteriota bacterium]
MKLIGFLVLVFLIGCSVQFRSPIVVKKTPKEKKVARPDKITPPPHLPSSATPKEPESPPTESFSGIPVEEEQSGKEILLNPPEETTVIREYSPQEIKSVNASKRILILSAEYLNNTEYKVLEVITVRDVSQTGFNRAEARDALQFEAYRRFGAQAKGIINIKYGEKSGFIPDTERFSEVSGEVITWEGEAPPPKKENENSGQ